MNILAIFAKTIIRIVYVLGKDVFMMFGKIIDMDNTDAFINFSDGTTMDISISRLPKNSKIGDSVDFNIGSPISMTNDKSGNLF
ncbi:hypothetical protein [Clostridium sp.]